MAFLLGFPMEMDGQYGVSTVVTSHHLEGMLSKETVPQDQQLGSAEVVDAMMVAWEKRSKNLKKWERKLFDRYAGMDLKTYTTKMKELCAAHQAKSKSYKVVNLIEPLFTTLRMFTPHVANATQASPTPAAPILGGIMCIMQISENYVQYQERIAKLLGKMGDKADVLLRYEKEVYQTDALVRESLIEIYGDILDFTLECLNLLTNDKGEPRNSLKLWGLSLWKPCEVKLGSCIASFERNIALFEERALLCDRLRQKEERALHAQTAVMQQQELGILSSIQRSIAQGIQGLQGLFIQQQLNFEREQKREERQRQLELQQVKEQRRMTVLRWLPSTQYMTQHDSQWSLHLEGTGQWLLNHGQYTDSKAREQSTLLWVKGKPGCGKSVLAALTVVDLELEKDSDVAVAFVYCKDEGSTALDATKLWCTILKQLCQQSADADQIYEDFSENITGGQAPTLLRIQSAISSVVRRFSQVYFVVDGLDECPDHGSVANFLNDLVRQPSSVVKAFVFSRPEYDSLKTAFEHYPLVAVDSGLNEEDIQRYITNIVCMENLTLRENPELLDRVKQSLLAKANGMFLWVKLLVNMLKRQSTWNKVLKTIDSVPSGLDGLYDLCLDRIWKHGEFDEEKRDSAFKVLLWTLNAKRPLSQEEVIEAIAIKSNQKILDENDQMDPRQLIESCADLITLNSEGCLVIIHASLRDYVQSNPVHHSAPFQKLRLLQKDAHQIIAQACLTYMLLDRFDCGPTSTLEELKKLQSDNAFLTYAASYWADHAALVSTGDCQRLVSELVYSVKHRELSMQHFLLLNEDKFCARDGKSTPLHFLAMYGLAEVAQLHLEELSNKNKFDELDRLPLDYALNGRSKSMTVLLLQPTEANGKLPEPYRGVYSPLHYAAMYDWPDVADILLSQGYDTEIETVDKATPLIRAVICGFISIVEKLLKANAKVNAINSDGDSALILAAYGDRLDIVEKLLEAGADPAIVGQGGETALHLAMLSKTPEIARLLLEHNADPIAIAEACGRQTPLHYAADKNACEIIKLLLAKNKSLDMLCHDKYTVMHVVAISGSTDAAKLLAKEGAEMNPVDSFGTLPYHRAAQADHTEILEFFHGSVTSVDVQDTYGDTALHYAARNGKSEAVKFLLKHGADMNLRNSQLESPLMSALVKGHFGLVKLLLENRADINLKDNYGGTALHYAAEYGRADAIESLLGANADANEVNKMGNTALHVASQKGHYEFMQRLIQLRPMLQLNKKNNAGKTPLLLAAREGWSKATKLLLDHGALQLRDEDNNFPLQLAAHRGHEDIVAWLINPETINAQGYRQRTPLWLASIAGNLNVVKMLAANGADLDIKDEEDTPPITVSMTSRKYDVTWWLLENGANPKIPDGFGTTPLHLASSIGNMKMMKHLLDCGCDGLVQDMFGSTPFMGAVSYDSVELVELFLERGFNGAKIHNRTDYSPFFTAVQNGNLAMMKLLHQAGADPLHVQDCSGHGALHIAAFDGKVNLIPYLMELGCDPDHRDRTAYSVLAAAAHQGFYEFVAKLLELKVDINSVETTTGMTPLICAASHHSARTIEMLIDAGADCEMRDRLGKSAYDYAKGHEASMAALGGRATESEVMSLESRREKYLIPTIKGSLETLLIESVPPTYHEIVDRREITSILGACLASLRDPSFEEIAALCYGEIVYTGTTDLITCNWTCRFCTSQMQQRFHVCTNCYDIHLCGTCYDAYKLGFAGEAMKIPEAYRTLQMLEKKIAPVWQRLYSIIDLGGPFFTIAFFYFNVMNEWIEIRLKDYKEWEEKYNKDNHYQRNSRPGQEFLETMKDALTALNHRIDEGPNLLNAKMFNDVERKLRDLNQITPAAREFRDFICDGHEYLEVTGDMWKKAKEDGSVRKEDGKVSHDRVQRLLERFASPKVEAKEEADTVAAAQSDDTKPGGLSVLPTDEVAASAGEKEPAVSTKPRRAQFSFNESSTMGHPDPITGVLTKPATKPDKPFRSQTLPLLEEAMKLKNSSALMPLRSKSIQLPRTNSTPPAQIPSSVTELAAPIIEKSSTSVKIGDKPLEESPTTSPVLAPADIQQGLDDLLSVNLWQQMMNTILGIPDTLTIELYEDESKTSGDIRSKTWTSHDAPITGAFDLLFGFRSVTVKFDAEDGRDLLTIFALMIIDEVEPGYPVRYFRHGRSNQYLKDIRAGAGGVSD